MLMRRLVTSVLLLLLILICTGLASCGQSGGGNADVQNGTSKVFYVSADGDDGNPGTEDLPLATFAGAVSAVRSWKTVNGLPDGGIEVVFASGRYSFDTGIVFGAGDSGEKGRPVTYRAAEGAVVTLDGGVLIDPSAFGPLSEEVRERLPEGEARDRVLEADLVLAGCYDLADRSDYADWDAYYDISGYRQELYADNVRQSPARWPDTGYESGEMN